ncbi:hypothetical protein FRC11_013126 [Ceratobasidium sp. 423]|nr:hypothetical protein FRC11_013126 [Ceratobasidium sp. 423]
MNNGNEVLTLVPPQLPPFLANAFDLKPIVGNPSHQEVKLVHEAVRALNNFLHTPELRDTDLSTELSQHLFDIQMAFHRQKYPVNVLPNDVVYNPPALPNYIQVKLTPVVGPPSNGEVASVHTALRISESFVNVPSIFDPDVHIQLSQHLFDIQFGMTSSHCVLPVSPALPIPAARHVQRSVVKRFSSALPAPQHPTVPDDEDANNDREARHPSQEAAGPTKTQHPMLEEPGPPNQPTSHQNPNESNEISSVKELMVEMRDTLKNMNRVMIGSQNSLARGFNSSLRHSTGDGISYDLGVHSLINDHGELPETYNLPTFKHIGGYQNKISLSLSDSTENELARYLRFYNIGQDLIEEGEELKIKSGMMNDARNLLHRRIHRNQH